MTSGEDATEENTKISAEPTKAFFVDMLTRDIELDQAILDLVDNSVDGAKRIRDGSFEGLWVEIEFSAEKFSIQDNCGGFDRKTAKEYAFRFGRPKGAKRTPHSIGQFGVGMKRALFKFGDDFSVASKTDDDAWAVSVNVPEWEETDDWHFNWCQLPKPAQKWKDNFQGTYVVVTKLNHSVAAMFSTSNFEKKVRDLISSKHRQFIANGLKISVNNRNLVATDIRFTFEQGEFSPAIENLRAKVDGKTVKIKLIVGVASSSPSLAGWYVICNGRVILEADRRKKTGWGAVEEATGRLLIPTYHNQFARFRGIAIFDSQDSSAVPWNTTKTDIDTGNPAWIEAFERMTELSRLVIDFLNALDRDIDRHTRDHSALYNYVEKTKSVSLENLPSRSRLRLPDPVEYEGKVKTQRVQYAKPITEIDFLKDQLDLASASAVGEKTFDIVYRKYK